jgi:hypothetical protein
VGEVLAVDMNNMGLDGGDFVRVRVWLDVRRSLARFVSFKLEEADQVIMRVKYEKIPLHSPWPPQTWPGGVRYQGTFTWEGRVRQMAFG